MQQQGGSQYGVPPSEMAPPFSTAEAVPRQQRMIGIPGGVEYLQQQQTVAEAASPISSRPAPQQPVVQRQAVSIFEDFGSGSGAVGGSFPDEETLGAGEDAERGGGAGNRWPRQETLALLKIRSEMDAAFRDATLKGPLWEDVSRKLAELGYARNAKKCKEKFENVHKYYKRTKEGNAGRQDGKSYRFFTQLEALHSTTSASGAAVNPLPPAPNPTTLIIPTITSAAPPLNTAPSITMTAAPSAARINPPAVTAPAAELAPAAVAAISFSSNTSSSSASESDGEETEEGGVGEGSRKRKREGWPGGSRKMMAFFDGLMKQVMERQEAMQQRFLDTIEKREQDRMIREEAWKRQEMARLNREYELMAQERTMAANRDAAVISFLQKFTGSPANQQQPAAAVASPEAAPVPESPQQQQNPPAQVLEPIPLQQPTMQIETNNYLNQPSASSEPAAVSEMADTMGVGSLDIISPSSSSRWPKLEVLALIKLRSALETRYLEAGPKGPLWEEISLAMKGLGYSRNAKRCKEKWENINKYFKKVKESNKKRPEDAKTCPYFHELDTLYRKKQLAVPQQQELAIAKTNPQQIGESLQTPVPISRPAEQESSNGQIVPRRNGAGLPNLFFGGGPNRGSGGAATKKPEDIVRELMGQQNQPRRVANDYDKLGDSVDSDTMNHEYDDDEDNYDDDDDEEDDGKLRYEIQFQRQAVGAAAGGVRGGNATGKVATTTTSSAGSFLAMVQ